MSTMLHKENLCGLKMKRDKPPQLPCVEAHKDARAAGVGADRSSTKLIAKVQLRRTDECTRTSQHQRRAGNALVVQHAMLVAASRSLRCAIACVSVAFSCCGISSFTYRPCTAGSPASHRPLRLAPAAPLGHGALPGGCPSQSSLWNGVLTVKIANERC
jgi:hypothetical protein